MLYYIRNKENDYWSNLVGWTESKLVASSFTYEEFREYNLPIGGRWEFEGGF